MTGAVKIAAGAAESPESHTCLRVRDRARGYARGRARSHGRANRRSCVVPGRGLHGAPLIDRVGRNGTVDQQCQRIRQGGGISGDGDGRCGAGLATEARRREMAEQEDQHPVRRFADMADQLAVAPDLLGHPARRPFERDRGEAADRQLQRRVPCLGEVRPARIGTQAIGGPRRDAGFLAGGGDGAGLRQRGEEDALPLGGPAVMAGAEGDLVHAMLLRYEEPDQLYEVRRVGHLIYGF